MTMVAVRAHPGAHVALVPRSEEIGVAVLALSSHAYLAPFVEHLVFHEKSNLVAKLQQPFVRRIVGRANGVHARILEEKQPAALGGSVPRRAENAEVVVHRHSVQRHGASVEHEAPLVRMERDSPDSVAVLVALDVHGVEIRVVDVPETRILHRECALLPAALRHLVADAHRGALRRHLRRRDEHAPWHDVVLWANEKPALSEQSAARVPSRRVLHIMASNGDHVFPRSPFPLPRSLLQLLCQINTPPSVPVRPSAEELAVKVKHRVAHRTVALEEHTAIWRNGDIRRTATDIGALESQLATHHSQLTTLNSKLHPIPADAGHVEEGVAVCSARVERLFNAPVVRHAHDAPGGIVEAWLRPFKDRCAGYVAPVCAVEDVAHRLHREACACRRVVGLDEPPPFFERHLHRCGIRHAG